MTSIQASERNTATWGGFRHYLALFVGLSVSFLLGALVLNLLVDPLWYHRGNIITGNNFAFNERISKVNLFFKNQGSVDCIIFGSSRVTLLDQTKLSQRRCINMAFSAGIAPEFVEYARYLKSFAADPALVIVGVDAFNFWRDMTIDVPDFVVRRARPPSRLNRYLSLGATRFSLRTLIGDTPFPRFYDRKFIGRVLDEAPDYKPAREFKLNEKQTIFDLSRVRYYRELRRIFPEARFIGYVPPLAAWEVAEELYVPGYLDRYLQAIGEIAADYDAFYDFSIPSSVTKDPRHTYDGDHFDARVNQAIARALQSGALGFGIVVDPTRLEDYRREYSAALYAFVEQQHRAWQLPSPQRAHATN